MVVPSSPGRMHAHMHICTHARMHTRTHAHTHACTHARMHACAHARMHACTYAHMHTARPSSPGHTTHRRDPQLQLLHHCRLRCLHPLPCHPPPCHPPPRLHLLCRCRLLPPQPATPRLSRQVPRLSRQVPAAQAFAWSVCTVATEGRCPARRPARSVKCEV